MSDLWLLYYLKPVVALAGQHMCSLEQMILVQKSHSLAQSLYVEKIKLKSKHVITYLCH